MLSETENGELCFKLEGLDANEVLRVAASLEQQSEHPLANAIVALADDPVRRQKIGLRASAHVREKFTIDHMADNLIRQLDSVADPVRR